MKWIALVLAAAVAGLVPPLVPAPCPAQERVARPAAPEVGSAGCKPQAPVRIAVQASGGSEALRLDYEIEPLVEAQALEVELRLPHGGAVAWHERPASGPLAASARRSGAARVELPPGGATVEVLARIAIEDPDAPGGVAWVTARSVVERGAVDRTPPEVRRIVHEGEVLLEVPSVRRGGTPLGGGR